MSDSRSMPTWHRPSPIWLGRRRLTLSMAAPLLRSSSASPTTPWRQAILVELIGKDPQGAMDDEVGGAKVGGAKAGASPTVATTAGPVALRRSPAPAAALASAPAAAPVDWDPPNLPAFRILRADDLVYIEYANGEREVYDLVADPYQLENLTAAAEPGWLTHLSERLAELSGCAAAGCRSAEDAPVEPVTLLVQPTPTILTPADHQIAVGETLILNGQAVDADGKPLPAEALSWEVLLHFGSKSRVVLKPTAGNNLTVVVPSPPSLEIAARSHMAVILTAIDPSGGRRTVVRELWPRLVDLTFATTPPGLVVRADRYSVPDGDVLSAWAGQSITLDAPVQLDGQGQPFRCVDWSDGEPCARTLTAPAAPALYTANYAAASIPAFLPSADASVRSNQPDVNNGQARRLLVVQTGQSTGESYLRFDVEGIGENVERALLWLYALEGEAEVVTLDGVETVWDETSITWESRLDRTSEALAAAGPVTAGNWLAFDVTAHVEGTIVLCLRRGGERAEPRHFQLARGDKPPTAPGDRSR